MSWNGFASAGAGVADSETQPFLEWGVASRPFGGAQTSGDVAVVRVFRDVALVAARRTHPRRARSTDRRRARGRGAVSRSPFVRFSQAPGAVASFVPVGAARR